jgi:hypothetical protein
MCGLCHKSFHNLFSPLANAWSCRLKALLHSYGTAKLEIPQLVVLPSAPLALKHHSRRAAFGSQVPQGHENSSPRPNGLRHAEQALGR